MFIFGKKPKDDGKGNNKPKIEKLTLQKGYLGEDERVDISHYPHEVKCATCGSPRWVRKQDLHQVKYCKPCTRKFRLERRRARAKEYYMEKKIADYEESLSDEDIKDA